MAIDNKEVSKKLADALASAPPYIQEFIRSGRFEAFMQAETTQYALHLDVSDKISNEILLTLLGFSSPDELVDALLGMDDLSDDAVPQLIENINEKIFVPLRNSLNQAPPPATPAPVQPPPAVMRPAAPSAPLQPLVPPPMLVAPVALPPHLETVPTPVVPPAPVVPPPPAPAAPIPMPPPFESSVSRIHSVPSAPPVPPPAPYVPQAASPGTLGGVPYAGGRTMRTMATDMQAVKENRMPEPLFAAPIPPHVPSAPPASVPSSIPQAPVPPMPPPMPTPPAIRQAPAIAPVRPLPPPPPDLPGAPALHAYNADPYREPVE